MVLVQLRSYKSQACQAAASQSMLDSCAAGRLLCGMRCNGPHSSARNQGQWQRTPSFGRQPHPLPSEPSESEMSTVVRSRFSIFTHSSMRRLTGPPAHMFSLEQTPQEHPPLRVLCSLRIDGCQQLQQQPTCTSCDHNMPPKQAYFCSSHAVAVSEVWGLSSILTTASLYWLHCQYPDTWPQLLAESGERSTHLM